MENYLINYLVREQQLVEHAKFTFYDQSLPPELYSISPAMGRCGVDGDESLAAPLVKLLEHKEFRSVAIKMLYHMSKDDESKSKIAFSGAIPCMCSGRACYLRDTDTLHGVGVCVRVRCKRVNRFVR